MAAMALPLLVIAVYIRVWTEQSVAAQTVEDIHVECRQGAGALESALSGAREDVLFLSQSPSVDALAQAMARDDGEAAAAARRGVEELFRAFAETKLIYDQVRFIDRSGLETVRVDSDGRRNWAAPTAELQSKSERYYFQKTMAVPEGHVYVSPLDLNRERGEIEWPLRPVLRYSTPVFARGEPVGIVITNMGGNRLLGPIRSFGGVGQGRRILVDQNGFYLAHYSRRKEWGGPADLRTGQNLRADYGGQASIVLAGQAGTLDLGDRVVSYHRVNPCPWDPERYWMLMQEVPRALTLAPVRRVRLALGAVFAASLVGAFVFSLYLSRQLSDPLRQVERGARLLGEGVLDHRVTVQTGDEVEVLADAFNEMAEQLAEARDQERLALVGRTAAGIVHDIRNPLTSIKGVAALLPDTETPEERTEFCQIVSHEADRILSMVQELLDFSRGKPAGLSLESVSAPELLAALERAIGPDMERAGIKLTIRADDTTVNADRDRILRVLANLASNAREAMAETEGTLLVEARRVGEVLQIAVQDSGPGIPDEIADNLFDPFVSYGKPSSTGLGLAICKQIVEAHGGTIGLAPSPDGGARFVVELPVHGVETTA
jgi:signal transduction histidine kinase